MECPFCLEDIKPGATVCRSCHRDVIVAMQQATTIANLKATIEDLRAQIAASGQSVSIPSTPIARPENSISPSAVRWKFYCSAAFLSAYIGVVLFSRAILPSEVHHDSTIGIFLITLLTFLIAIPFVGAFRLPFGMFVWSKQALLTGVVGAILVRFIRTIIETWRTRQTPDLMVMPETPAAYLGGILAVSLILTILFLAGAFAGHWLQKRKKGIPITGGVQKVAIALSPQKRKGEDTRDFDRRIQRVSTVITAFAPIIALMGSVIVAVVGYFANIRKTP